MPITDSEIMNFDLALSQNPTFEQKIKQLVSSSLKIEQDPEFNQALGRLKEFNLEA